MCYKSHRLLLEMVSTFYAGKERSGQRLTVLETFQPVLVSFNCFFSSYTVFLNTRTIFYENVEAHIVRELRNMLRKCAETG